MASKTFKPEKSAKITGGPATKFNQTVSEIGVRGEVSNTAKADAWAKKVNQVGWEKEAYKTDDPNATS